jgi:hypothetical protein
MATTDLTVGADSVTARTTSYSHGDNVFYSVNDPDGVTGVTGTFVVQPARLGMHPQYGVMITIGGYSGNAQVGDWSVHGTVVCSGDDMTPGPHPTAKQYPLGQVRKDDPDTADLLADLLTAIAWDYVHSYSGNGLR